MRACATVIVDPSDVLVAIGAAIIALVLARWWRRTHSRTPEQEDAQDGLQVRRVQEKGDEILAEIESAGREVLSRAETRIRVLNELLVRAEETAASAPAGDPARGVDRAAEVCRLAGEGLGPIEIARRTGLEPGEVELILSLRRTSGLEGAAPDEGKQARS
jgi:hypothetical protein